MRLTSRSSLLALAVGLAAVACGDSRLPVEPSAAAPSGGANYSRAVGLRGVDALLRDRPLGQASASAVIDGAVGGTLSLPAAGLSITVPAGAFAGTLTISVNAVPGKMVAYEFEPHGTQFNVPLIATQSLSGLRSVRGALDPATMGIGYFADASQLDHAHNSATVSEILGVSVDLSAQTATFSIPHFSGWLASGRCSSDDE
jgi:hypothetical protein